MSRQDYVAAARSPLLAVDPAKPSFTATYVLAFRALGTKIPDAGMRNPDLLAPRFLSSRERELLLDVRARLQGTPRDEPLFTDVDFDRAANFMRDQTPDLFARFLFVLARTRHMDACLRQALDDGACQVVVLGAGYDSRAYRTEHPSRPRFFEADFPATQEYKKMRVRELFGSLPQHVVFVPIDFEKGSVAADLKNSGYRKSQKTFFIWEGVTCYLSETAAAATLGEAAGQMAPGSSIVFDYAIDAVIRGEHDDEATRQSMELLKLLREPYLFGLPEGGAAGWVDKLNLKVTSDLGPQDLTAQYLTSATGATLGEPCWYHRICLAAVK